MHYDHDMVCHRLEDAGKTLLALPPERCPTTLGVLGSALDSARWSDQSHHCVAPSIAAVYVLRRVVGARALVHPITDRYFFTWRRLGAALGADHKAVQRWHRQGIDLIVAALNARRE